MVDFNAALSVINRLFRKGILDLNYTLARLI